MYFSLIKDLGTHTLGGGSVKIQVIFIYYRVNFTFISEIIEFRQHIFELLKEKVFSFTYILYSSLIILKNDRHSMHFLHFFK